MNKLEQAAWLALEALEEMFYNNSTKVAVEKYNTAHNALREALAQPTVEDSSIAQEPVAWLSENGLVITDQGAANCWVENGFTATPLYTTPTQPSNQKPIAWWNGAYDITMNSFEAGEDWTPLYAAPVRTKDPCNPLQDLTDDEIISALDADMDTDEDKAWFIEMVRLGIAADRELNQ